MPVAFSKLQTMLPPPLLEGLGRGMLPGCSQSFAKWTTWYVAYLGLAPPPQVEIEWATNMARSRTTAIGK